MALTLLKDVFTIIVEQGLHEEEYFKEICEDFESYMEELEEKTAERLEKKQAMAKLPEKEKVKLVKERVIKASKKLTPELHERVKSVLSS